MTLCLQGLQKTQPEKELLLLAYEMYYPDVLQVEASNSASASPFNALSDMNQRTREIIKRNAALHPQWQKFEFTGQHCANIACDLYLEHLYA